MTDWHPTPPERLITAEAYDPETGTWTKCHYSNLRKGAIFKAFAADGQQIDPLTEDPVESDVVAVAADDPIKNDDIMSNPEIPPHRIGEGYCIEVAHVGTLDEIRSKLS